MAIPSFLNPNSAIFKALFGDTAHNDNKATDGTGDTNGNGEIDGNETPKDGAGITALADLLNNRAPDGDASTGKVTFDADGKVSNDTNYTITPSATSVTEGGVVTYNITASNAFDGKLTYTLSGAKKGADSTATYDITTGDVKDGLTGTVDIKDGKGSFTVATVADKVTEPDEIMNISLDSVNANPVTLVIKDGVATTPTYKIEADKTSIDEKGTDDIVTYTVTTTNVAEGTKLNYTFSDGGTGDTGGGKGGDASSTDGITKEDLTGGSLTGQVIIGADGKGTFTASAVADNKTEGDETLVVTLDDDATAKVSTTIKDTSTTSAGPTVQPLTGGAQNAHATFDAGTASFKFTDDLTAQSFVDVSNFTADDSIEYAVGTTVAVSSAGTDITLIVNNGTVSEIDLIGVNPTGGFVADVTAFNALAVGDITFA